MSLSAQIAGIGIFEKFALFLAIAFFGILGIGLFFLSLVIGIKSGGFGDIFRAGVCAAGGIALLILAIVLYDKK